MKTVINNKEELSLLFGIMKIVPELRCSFIGDDGRGYHFVDGQLYFDGNESHWTEEDFAQCAFPDNLYVWRHNADSN